MVNGYDPGTFRHRLTIQTVTQTPDGQGGQTETWTDGQKIWASIEPLKAFQRFQAMQMQTPATHRIIMRYRTDLDTTARLVFDSRIFFIKEIINHEERNRFLILTVNERM